MIAQSNDDFQVEREEWNRLSLLGLARAYGDDEPEYTLDMPIEINPDFQPEPQDPHESDTP